MSKQSWRGSTLLNPEPPVLVSCGGLDKPNLITIGWTGTICTQPSMVSISVRPDADAHHAGLGADGARPADGDEVGLIQPAAGDQHRRFRVQQGAAPPALFAHP